MSADAQTRIAELERQVAHLTEQNANAMRELDAFAYAVSHDLRAPLRSLSGFSQALLEGGEADPLKTRHYLERIQQASRKLSDLIDALLALSRASRAEMHVRDIDFSRLCSDAAATIAAKYADRVVQVTVAPNLAASGDQRLLRTAMELLFDNAWKFTFRQASPTIEIGRTTAGEFYIADNGMGFDPTYAEKLFKPFQRLHAEQQIPGIGIGLATVQRIVSRHGGRIRIDGILNGGATAFFALPPPQGTPT
jgi:signal transduction histidine kinase